jgi:hypothetical protein
MLEKAMLRSSLKLMVATLVFGSGMASADVYKFVDAHGNVLYTDKPATLPAERLSVQSHKTDTAEAQARQQAEMSRMQAANQASTQNAQQQADKKQAGELTEKDKAERCVKARERYDSYMNSQRLYEAQANGERRYLTDAELTTARTAAKSTMDELCK